MILISDIARPLYRLEWTPQYFNADDWIACGKIIAVIWGFVLACVLIRNSLVWLLEKKIDLNTLNEDFLSFFVAIAATVFFLLYFLFRTLSDIYFHFDLPFGPMEILLILGVIVWLAKVFL